LALLQYAHQPVSRSDRLCRFCRNKVETPEHTLITCQSSDAVVELEVILQHSYLICQTYNAGWQNSQIPSS
ncbi:hypothetical protein B0H11DRAFT_1733937, partial [Mycena galericulata]